MTRPRLLDLVTSVCHFQSLISFIAEPENLYVCAGSVGVISDYNVRLLPFTNFVFLNVDQHLLLIRHASRCLMGMMLMFLLSLKQGILKRGRIF